ncbi:MAG: hypothetical protein ACD_49C00056G0014 [uncultured bacterium (gcode 4)]|uniref:Prepilin-type N-terminal cleavage/methylation domain-containing protein n=1 Tax=uncultured bacterium (gcode 4) TaxID=1234023 RepID=K2BVK2_9BACT|nr:MAG: hypothetical protein ACD_49C00056G0014 [uncultured bacterium (gcode 4)]
MIKNIKGFTLIELMIVITIIWFLTMLVAVPYNFYANISKVRISKEIIDQSRSDAISSANWRTSFDWKNINIGLYFDKNKWEILSYSYPFNYSWSVLNFTGDVKLLKTIKLESFVEISKIKIGSDETENVLLYYKAPDGKLTIYKNATSTWNTVDIVVGYKWVTEGVLSKEIKIKN